MMNPPKAGERKMLPRMATYGLQIVSPAGGRPAAAGPLGSGAMLGNGGGPTAGVGIGIADTESGSGGGFDTEEGREASGSVFTGSDGFSGGADDEDAAAASGTDARNSEIGIQEDFASFQARSAGLKVPSAIFSRMAASENRPANCPFR